MPRSAKKFSRALGFLARPHLWHRKPRWKLSESETPRGETPEGIGTLRVLIHGAGKPFPIHLTLKVRDLPLWHKARTFTERLQQPLTYEPRDIVPVRQTLGPRMTAALCSSTWVSNRITRAPSDFLGARLLALIF